MKPFLGKDFLLDTKPARRLFHDYAEDQPILDYHTHLIPQQIAENAQFGDLAQVWLGGDHYKWRLMRANGIPEADITGHPADEKTFLAWARTVPKTVGSPLYHWTHLELQRYFGIDDVLNEATAASIWKRANERLADPSFRVHGLLEKFRVRAVCTTDDPADDLAFHHKHRQNRGAVMAPTFRPDKALACAAAGYAAYVEKLGAAAGVVIRTYRELVVALGLRHRFFAEAGCRLSDHAVVIPPAADAAPEQLEAVFQRAVSGQPVPAAEAEAFQCALLVEVGRLNAAAGWTMQIHLGAQRNLNSRMFTQLGPDTGYDAIHDAPVAAATAGLLDRMARSEALPRVILYGLNPSSHDALATVMGGFQDGTAAGKIQLGSAWWFNDHIDGMDLQLRTLANHGLLSRFVGMLTDSRSFLSFPRHEYFRRVLCRLLGNWMESGLAPASYEHVGGMVRDICFANVKSFLQLV